VASGQDFSHASEINSTLYVAKPNRLHHTSNNVQVVPENEFVLAEKLRVAVLEARRTTVQTILWRLRNYVSEVRLRKPPLNVV